MAEQRDYYAILQVSRNASQEEIEKSYARLSKIYNPESSRKPRAAARYKEITEAYSVLSDRKTRADYDRTHLRKAGTVVTADGAVTGFISQNYVWIAVGGVVGSIVLALVLIIVLGGGGSTNAVKQEPTATVAVDTGTPGVTPEGQTPAPTAPSSPPDVSGQEQTTSSGLKYVDIQEGTGAPPKTGDKITVNYTGWVQADGTKFDSSVDRGQPFSFVIGQHQVIAGWDEGLATMKVGGTRRLIIPPDLAYGDKANGAIPASSTLIFDVEMLQVGSGAATATP